MVVVAVVVMVVVAVVVMVVVAVVIMVVVAVIVVTVVVVCVCATHLQNDKVEGFDARGFEFKHVLAFLEAVDVNHRVSGARSGAVDGFLGPVVLVTFVVVMFVAVFLFMVRFGDHGVVDERGCPSNVRSFVQHHVINAHLAGFPVVTGFVPNQQGPVPRSVCVNTADAGDHVAPGAQRGVPGDVVCRQGGGGEVPSRRVLWPIRMVLGFKRN